MGGWNENVTVDPCLQCWRTHCSCRTPPCCRPSSRCGLAPYTGTPPRCLVWGKSVFEGKALMLKFHCTNIKKQCTRFWTELSFTVDLDWNKVLNSRFSKTDSPGFTQKEVHLVLHTPPSDPSARSSWWSEGLRLESLLALLMLEMESAQPAVPIARWQRTLCRDFLKPRSRPLASGHRGEVSTPGGKTKLNFRLP